MLEGLGNPVLPSDDGNVWLRPAMTGHDRNAVEAFLYRWCDIFDDKIKKTSCTYYAK